MKNLILTSLALILLNSCSSEKSSDKDASAGAKNPQDVASQQENDSATGTVSTEQRLTYEPSDFVHTYDGNSVEIAGISFTPPSQWKDLGASKMRVADYTFGPLEPDKDSSTLAVFFFGKDQGGTIEDNIERWINQTALPDGRDAHTGNIQYKLEVDGMTVHILSIYGFYQAPVGDPMSREKINKENYRFVGAVVEAPGGNLFFKLTGPDYTARIMIEGFMPMIKAILKA